MPFANDQKISIVVPARNEEATIAQVVQIASTHPAVDEIIVVNNGSSDNTADVAGSVGASVIQCQCPGLGRAMKVGLKAAKNRYILRTDADIENWNANWINQLSPPSPNCLNRGIYQSPYNQLPISNYVVRPFFELYRPEWANIPIPTTGTYLFDRDCVVLDDLPNNWAIDVAILLLFLEDFQSKKTNTNIGTLSDAIRPVSHYIPMATDINEFLTSYFIREIADKIM